MSTNLQQSLDRQRRKVDVENFDLTVREIVRMATDGELIRAPSYQRLFRWEEEDESRLVESLLLGLPVPPIFVAANPDGKWELVDGLQRVSTLLHFVEPGPAILAEIGKSGPLKLCGLDTLDDFNGLELASLPTPIALSFRKRFLRVTALSDKSEADIRFALFERLNRGGIALSPQEVRACIFRGPFNKLIKDLSSHGSFEAMLKLQAVRRRDGTKEEQVLKFFAYLDGRADYQDKVKLFLNAFMDSHSHNVPTTYATDFQAATDYLHSVVGGHFLRSSTTVTPLNQFEAALVATSEIIRQGRSPNGPQPGWLEDQVFVGFSDKGTNAKKALLGRIDRARALLDGATPA